MSNTFMVCEAEFVCSGVPICSSLYDSDPAITQVALYRTGATAGQYDRIFFLSFFYFLSSIITINIFPNSVIAANSVAMAGFKGVWATQPAIPWKVSSRLKEPDLNGWRK